MVFDAGIARQRRKTLSLRLFALDARLTGVLHAKDAPGACQRTAQSRLVIQIALDDLDALVRQRRRPFAFRLARQAAQMETRAPQRLRHRSALLACHSGDENRSIVCHGLSLLPSLFSGPNYIPGWSGAGVDSGPEQCSERRSYVDEDHRPQYSNEEGQRKPAR